MGHKARKIGITVAVKTRFDLKHHGSWILTQLASNRFAQRKGEKREERERKRKRKREGERRKVTSARAMRDQMNRR